MSDPKSDVILLGYSGHGYVVAEAAISAGHTFLGYTEDEKLDQNPFGFRYLGDERNSAFNWRNSKNFALGVGNNKIRAKIAKRVASYGGECLIVIHPDASIAIGVRIGNGTFIARNAAINPLALIGRNVIINTSCSVDHECRIEDNVHVAPGAVLAGDVKVGNGAFIGANSVIKEGVNIGEGAVVGAGSVIIRDVVAGKRIVGNPGKYIA